MGPWTQFHPLCDSFHLNYPALVALSISIRVRPSCSCPSRSGSFSSNIRERRIPALRCSRAQDVNRLPYVGHILKEFLVAGSVSEWPPDRILSAAQS